MVVNIGINGFGRLGRMLLRISIDECSKCCGNYVPLVSIINDPTVNPESLGYLIKKDGHYGTYQKEVIDMDNNCVMVEGHKIELVQEINLTKVPWQKSGPVHYIIDTTGQNGTSKDACELLQENIKGAIVTGVGDVSIFIMGVNHTCYKPSIKTVSVGSPSLNCLSAMLRVLNDSFKVKTAIATIIQPYANCCNLLDDSSPKGRKEGKSVLSNIIPIHTEAGGRFVARIIPELENRVESIALRAPVPCVGSVDLTASLCQEASTEQLNAKFKEAADAYMKGVIRYSKEDIVSSDIIGDRHSCVIDGNVGVTAQNKNLAKCFAWYDAEYGYAYRLYEMIKYVISRNPEKFCF